VRREDEAPSRRQNPFDLSERPEPVSLGVDIIHSSEREDDSVERVVFERKLPCVALADD
jgi:hypothetical protein